MLTAGLTAVLTAGPPGPADRAGTPGLPAAPCRPAWARCRAWRARTPRGLPVPGLPVLGCRCRAGREPGGGRRAPHHAGPRRAGRRRTVRWWLLAVDAGARRMSTMPAIARSSPRRGPPASSVWSTSLRSARPPIIRSTSFAPSTRIEQALATSAIDHVVLRPTAFMEHHAHGFNGKGLLESGKAKLIGPGTKPRNFVCAEDVAEFAVRALLRGSTAVSPARDRRPGSLQQRRGERAVRAQRPASRPRIGHLPPRVAGTMGDSGAAVSPRAWPASCICWSLPDDAFPERFDGAAELEHRFGVRLTTLEAFVQRQVSAARPAGSNRPDRR